MEKLILLQDDPNAFMLAKIADLLGVGHDFVREIPKQPSCMILPGPYYDQYQEDIKPGEHTVLVYDAGSSRIFAAQLKPFRHVSSQIKIGDARRDVTSVLSGLSFQAAVTATVFSFFQGFEPLVFLDEYPLFLARERLFLLATDRVLDIDRDGKEGCEPYREYFTELLPFAMFIKAALKEHCWHLPEPSPCIVIDDPLLRRRHGFIDIPVFVEWLRANSLAATFAFIPWNHDRSWATTAELFNRNSDRLSICVHGCDHTEGEFAIADATHLDGMARTAMARMAAHESKHALRHDRIMIFPQGKFTRDALSALQRNGYVAAVNTGLFPTNENWNPTVRELLDLALVIPSGVPLFNRRYPVDLFDFACDIFFEKPVLIVQHHRDFRDGFNSLQSFIRELDRIKPGMKWLPLGALLAQSSWHRAEDNGVVRIRKLVREGQDGPWAEMDYSPKARAKIALKRYLCEFRDNHVDRSKIMTCVVKSLRKLSDALQDS